ncbi:MAG: AAA family ATPase [Bryobacterales bacterium]|nr:AAA family ATPase [Bryobacterales bacterium]
MSQDAKTRLPIGIQTFRKVREGNLHYVDKTGFALKLVLGGTHYFLSRPRRFGKSLFVDTLKDLFEGNRDLFEGLEAYRHWDWSVRYPVVRLEFGRGNYAEPGHLQVDLMAQMDSIERLAGVRAQYDTGPQRLAELLETLHHNSGQRVVVLVDEYDKPILDALDQPGMAQANRDYLRGLYSVIKSSDAHVHFCFLAGVSKFSKVSLFSGLNNLVDITLEPEYSSICGYAERDLDTVFATELAGLDRQQIREWYNGYSWGGEERVYNPFDVLLLLRKRALGAWWFETGTPTFLINLLAESGVPWHRLDGLRASEALLSTFDVGRIAPEALLFQTGYLTVVESESRGGRMRYQLGYPNREVRESLNRALLDDLLGSGFEREDQETRLLEVLEAADFGGMHDLLRSLLAGIPHQWHGRNPMRSYEGWYASVLYAHFAATGADVRAEESGSIGVNVRAGSGGAR